MVTGNIPNVVKAWAVMFLSFAVIGLLVCAVWLPYSSYFHLTAGIATAEVKSISQVNAASYRPILKYVDSKGEAQEITSPIGVALEGKGFYEIGDEIEVLVKDGEGNAKVNHLMALYGGPLIVFFFSNFFMLVSLFLSLLVTRWKK